MERKKLIQYLEETGKYKEVDETQVDLYLQTIWVAIKAFEDIQNRGVQVNIRAAGKPPFYQTNGSVGAFFSAIKSIQSLANQLGLSPKARKELGFENNLPKEDEWDKYAKM